MHECPANPVRELCHLAAGQQLVYLLGREPFGGVDTLAHLGDRRVHAAGQCREGREHERLKVRDGQ